MLQSSINYCWWHLPTIDEHRKNMKINIKPRTGNARAHTGESIQPKLKFSTSLQSCTSAHTRKIPENETLPCTGHSTNDRTTSLMSLTAVRDIQEHLTASYVFRWQFTYRGLQMQLRHQLPASNPNTKFFRNRSSSCIYETSGEMHMTFQIGFLLSLSTSCTKALKANTIT